MCVTIFDFSRGFSPLNDDNDDSKDCEEGNTVQQFLCWTVDCGRKICPVPS